MSIQSINTVSLPSLEPSRGKASAGKAKPAPVENQIRTSNAESGYENAKPADMVRELNKLTHKMGSELSFSVDSELNQVVVTVTDLNTREVIRQIPSEEMIALARRLKEMDGGSDAKGVILRLNG